MTEGDAAGSTGTVGAMDTTDAIVEYARRGWQSIPVRYKSKQPAMSQWQDARLGVEELVQHFESGPFNLGVLLGEPSRNLLDVDLDDLVAVSLADKFLPMTGAEFGHASKRRSHRLYVTEIAARTQKYQDGTDATLVELRGTGGTRFSRRRRIALASPSIGMTMATPRVSRRRSFRGPFGTWPWQPCW